MHFRGHRALHQNKASISPRFAELSCASQIRIVPRLLRSFCVAMVSSVKNKTAKAALNRGVWRRQIDSSLIVLLLPFGACRPAVQRRVGHPPADWSGSGDTLILRWAAFNAACAGLFCLYARGLHLVTQPVGAFDGVDHRAIGVRHFVSGFAAGGCELSFWRWSWIFLSLDGNGLALFRA